MVDPTRNLSADELLALVRRVFAPRETDSGLVLLTDLPDEACPDNAEWQRRRHLVAQWWRTLEQVSGRLGLPVRLFAYRNVRRSNADLPAAAWAVHDGVIPTRIESITEEATPFADLFARHNLVIAVTELSATAPLKLAAPRHRLRAATMPGFSPDMIPALRLDYEEVDRRVRFLAGLLDAASAAVVDWAEVGAGTRRWSLHLDLRHRRAHASGGLLHFPGTAGNLPSGEAYIVPYEGELADAPSQSQGVLPVELDGEIVVYRVEQNRAVAVEAGGPAARQEAALLRAEPAYGNLAELGLGVLAELGVAPTGKVLLDEKLGLHIAFGRSDHFGGQVGAAQFSRPEAVVHIDRVYVPALQPSLRVVAVDLVDAAGHRQPLMRDGNYVVSW